MASKRKSRSDEEDSSQQRAQLGADGALLASLEAELLAASSRAVSGYAGSGAARAALAPFIESVRAGIASGLRTIIESSSAHAGAGAGAGAGTEEPLDRELAAQVQALERQAGMLGKQVLEHRETVRRARGRAAMSVFRVATNCPSLAHMVPSRVARNYHQQFRRATQSRWRS